MGAISLGRQDGCAHYNRPPRALPSGPACSDAARPLDASAGCRLGVAAAGRIRLGSNVCRQRLGAGGDDGNPGTPERPLRTINRAAQLAQPGDTVHVHGGVYRERIAPARSGRDGAPIVYLAAAGERVVIKGSDIWRPQWQKCDDQRPVYRGTLDPLMFMASSINPFGTWLKRPPGGRRLTLGQVFLDGRPLREVDNESDLLATPESWLVEQAGASIRIHFAHETTDPGNRLIEITTRTRIFAPRRRGLGYIHVKGFTMEHCANQYPDRFWESDSPQAGALGCRAGHHWLIEGNTVRFAESIGIDCGYEGRHDPEGGQPTPQNTGWHVIRNNVVSDNGCCGIAGMRSIGTRIVGNVVERNNVNRHTAPEVAGIKVHYFIDGRIENNVIRDNEAHGIWVDNVYRQARITRNVVVGNRGNGIFFELGDGPALIDHNVIGNTRPGHLPQDPRGDGFYSHDASGLTFAHNLVFGSHRFGSFHLKATERPRAGASRIRLLNNIFLHNQEGHINLPAPGPAAEDNRADHNLFSAQGQYLINPWGGAAVDGLAARIERSSGRPVPRWNQAALCLSLRDWQALSGWGWQSLETDRAVVELTDDLVLRFDLGSSLRRVPAESIEGVDADYFGRPLPVRDRRIGPFQAWMPGLNERRLLHE